MTMNELRKKVVARTRSQFRQYCRGAGFEKETPSIYARRHPELVQSLRYEASALQGEDEYFYHVLFEVHSEIWDAMVGDNQWPGFVHEVVSVPIAWCNTGDLDAEFVFPIKEEALMLESYSGFAELIDLPLQLLTERFRTIDDIYCACKQNFLFTYGRSKRNEWIWPKYEEYAARNGMLLPDCSSWEIKIPID